MRLRSQQRIRKAADFAAMRAYGKRLDCGSYLFCYRLDTTFGRREGVIVSKKIGNAVRRNYAKRRLREVFRLHQDSLPVNCDILLIARPSIDRMPFKDIEQRFLEACQRIM